MRYRLPDGTDVQKMDPAAAYELLTKLTATRDAASATSGVPTRRVYVKPQGASW